MQRSRCTLLVLTNAARRAKREISVNGQMAGHNWQWAPCLADCHHSMLECVDAVHPGTGLVCEKQFTIPPRVQVTGSVITPSACAEHRNAASQHSFRPELLCA